MKFPASVQHVIEILETLPGLGPKSAERLVFYLLKQNTHRIQELADAFKNLTRDVTYCQSCHNISDINPCAICRNARRDLAVLCVVAKPQDLVALENTGDYHGLYHVLWGTLSAIDGITPDKLKIRELLERLKTNQFSEIILAFNTNIEGESTILYLKEALKPFPIKISRLAKGLPMGSELEYADEITLANAMEGRISLK